MKVAGHKVERCALCGGLPMLVVEVGGVSCCQCIRCHHKSQEIETEGDINAAAWLAVDAWNVEMGKRRDAM